MHVTGASNGAQILFDSDYGTGYVGQENNTSNNLIIGSSSAGITFYAANAEKMRIDSSGNVGIGITSPNGVLSVAGSISLEPGGGYSTTLSRPQLVRGADGELKMAAGSDTSSIITLHTSSSAGGTLTERMRIDSSGNVGIGGTPTTYPLEVFDTNGNGIAFKDTTNSVTNFVGAYNSVGISGTLTNHPYALWTNNAERMRIDTSGNLLWANTGGVSSSVQGIQFNNTTHPYIQVSGGSDTAFRYRMEFINGNGTVGTITTSGSATAYNTSSDYRLKENIVEMNGAIDRVKLLQPKRFNFIADADKTVDGFLAHEVQDIVPEAIHGVKDEVDEEGNPKYQGIDQSKLVPLLTKAIQEQQVLIEQLQAEVALLKGE